MKWWMSDCCLIPSKQFAKPFYGENKLLSMRWWWCRLCTRPPRLVRFFIVLPHITESTVAGHYGPAHFSDCEPTNLNSYSLMLRAYRRSSKFQFYCLWLVTTGPQTHDQAHSWRGRFLIHHPYHTHGEDASYYTIHDVLFKVQRYGLRKDMHWCI